jgi:hypothetical protein
LTARTALQTLRQVRATQQQLPEHFLNLSFHHHEHPCSPPPLLPLHPPRAGQEQYHPPRRPSTTRNLSIPFSSSLLCCIVCWASHSVEPGFVCLIAPFVAARASVEPSPLVYEKSTSFLHPLYQRLPVAPALIFEGDDFGKIGMLPPSECSGNDGAAINFGNNNHFDLKSKCHFGQDQPSTAVDQGVGTTTTNHPPPTRPAATGCRRLPVAFTFVGMMMAAVLGHGQSVSAARPPRSTGEDHVQGEISLSPLLCMCCMEHPLCSAVPLPHVRTSFLFVC